MMTDARNLTALCGTTRTVHMSEGTRSIQFVCGRATWLWRDPSNFPTRMQHYYELETLSVSESLQLCGYGFKSLLY